MGISNYIEYSNNLAAGAQPSIEDLKSLKEKGFEAIVNISPFSTKNYLPEEPEIIEKLNMYFVHFPIDCSNLQDFHYPTFKGILNGLKNKKVFVHCGGNIKSSNLIHMYNVLENHINELDSAKTLSQIQTPEHKWIEYFKKFGMHGMLS